MQFNLSFDHIKMKNASSGYCYVTSVEQGKCIGSFGNVLKCIRPTINHLIKNINVAETIMNRPHSISWRRWKKHGRILVTCLVMHYLQAYRPTGNKHRTQVQELQIYKWLITTHHAMLSLWEEEKEVGIIARS